ncbi:hypothetical protein RR46_09248 [Papilio xuthus]|uniref:Uncharacterized protein n=1 Tax=Papilio xuthus TaxID=66420 RepID=A0A194PVB7_PAPXU|nr:hypothetical protein RR46_09248 [Papilio xuthus]
MASYLRVALENRAAEQLWFFLKHFEKGGVWWWAGACAGGAVLLCAAGALARPHLRRRNTAAAANPLRQSELTPATPRTVPQPCRRVASVLSVGLNTQMQVDRLSVCARTRRYTARPVCGDIGAVGAAGAPSPARSPRYAAANTAASASLNNKTRSMAGVFLPI